MCVIMNFISGSVLLALWARVSHWMLNPKSVFKIGDRVQLIAPMSPTMLVTKVYCFKRCGPPLIECLWFEKDPDRVIRRTNLFQECKLKPSSRRLETFGFYDKKRPGAAAKKLTEMTPVNS